MEALGALLGVLGLGRHAVLASPHSAPSELAALVEAAAIAQVVGDREVCERVAAVVDARLPLDSPSRADPTGAGRLADDSATAAILFQSSGTTGPAKIAIREMDALDAVGSQVREAVGMGAGTRLLVTIPLCHSYGIDLALLAGLLGGCEIHLQEGFNPTATKLALRSGRVDLWPAVPVMLDAVSRGTQPEGSASERLRVLSAGSPLPRSVAERFHDVFGAWPAQIYGSSEFGSVTFNDPAREDFDPCSVGRPMRGVTIGVVAMTDGDPHPMPAGREGEIVVDAPSRMTGYLDGPGSTVQLDDLEALRTGDTGFLDEEGRLHLTGRTRLFIDVGGQKVNPIEVESVLMRYPGVELAVVIAAPYLSTADRVKAILVPEEGATLDVAEVRRFARLHLSPFKLPRRFEIRKELPRSPTGKVLRSEVQAQETRAAVPPRADPDANGDE